MKKTAGIIISLAMAGAVLTACTSGSSAPASTTAAQAAAAEVKQEATETIAEAVAEAQENKKDNSDITIAYVVGTLSNEVFAAQVKAMEAYCKEVGVNFIYTPCEDTAARISAVENYTGMLVDVIICHVNDSGAMVDCMQAAQAEGVKFMSYDAKVEGCDVFYGWDNYELGQAIGQNAVDWIKANFDEDEPVYAANLNRPTFEFLVVREQGYLDKVSEECPNVQWVVTGEGGNAPNGIVAGENFLQCGYDINVVCSINDGGALGVYEAFKAAGYEGDKVGIFGCDATSDGLKALAEGGIYRGTITTGLVDLAPDFIDVAINLANDVPETDHLGGMTAITIDNVKDYLK